MDEFFIDIIRIIMVVLVYVIAQACIPLSTLIKIFNTKFVLDKNNISTQLILPVGTILIAIVSYLFRNIPINEKYFYMRLLFSIFIHISLFLTVLVLGIDAIFWISSFYILSLIMCIFLFFHTHNNDKYLYIFPIIWFFSYSIIYFGGTISTSEDIKK